MPDLLQYTQKTQKLYPPHVADVLGISEQEVYKRLAKLWDKFDNAHVFNNMIRTSDRPRKWYVETCPSPYKRGQYVPEEQLENFCISHQGTDRHISVFSHCKNWKKNADKGGSVSCQGTLVKAPVFWIELDRKWPDGSGDYEWAVQDAKKIKKSFPYPDHLKIFSSGNTSTHLAINPKLFGDPITDQKHTKRGRVWYNLAHKIAGGMRFGGIRDVYFTPEEQLRKQFEIVYPDYDQPEKQTLRQSQENLDPIYSTNALIRQPFSKHQKTGQKKKVISGEQSLQFPPTKPHLLSWWFECFYFKERPKRAVDIDVDSSQVIKAYSKYIEDFDPSDANPDGWCGPYYNPLYRDTRASCYIQLDNGYLKDFGSETYSMHFDEFLNEINK